MNALKDFIFSKILRVVKHVHHSIRFPQFILRALFKLCQSQIATFYNVRRAVIFF